MGGGRGGMIPLGSYDLSDPKNPWIADRKRSTKSPIATSPPWSFMISDLVDHFIRMRWNYCTLEASFIHLPPEYGLSRGLFTLYSRFIHELLYSVLMSRNNVFTTQHVMARATIAPAPSITWLMTCRVGVTVVETK